ncbi:MAG: hypothetical protein M1831_001229 [Alyxoria varia]|nr:MAG: hypothetical protein M1831_001229 [Alyxoria varia]
MISLSKSAVASLLTLAAIPVAAAPAPQTINANFDDLDFRSPVPALKSFPNPYKSLCYVNYLGSNNEASTFVAPASSPNLAASDVTTRLTQGVPTLKTTGCDTNVKSFDLRSVFVSCAVIAANAEASAPVSCNYLLTGTTKSGNKVTKTFKYTPASLVKPPMQKIDLPPSFKDLTSVEFTLPNKVENVADVILTDSYTYTVKY